MGNRAYVVFENPESTEFSPAIYLHWNGGPESVYAFLKVFDDYGCRKTDLSYAASRFCQIVGNYFGGTLSLGLENVKSRKDLNKFLPGDNGLFVFAWMNDEKQWRCRRMTGHFTDPGVETATWWTPEAVEQERKTAMKHHYWVPTNPDCPPIVQDIHEKNDRFFEESKNTDAVAA